ncbi:MMPL family transporter [Acinetobacter larvae]|uniref:Acyl-sn-glycerol-3-phosphate acyltransferase n=1 Tax=Acinetobacter larvae TaxID=1789224 RepID=A0A1B2M270_9GAMM|nr:hypothetical protein [Acinetobacter larvae]AOA59287.1 acyl-sn-glycerol-3-phosphate acyltransferase [Acinetobacter larvae]
MKTLFSNWPNRLTVLWLLLLIITAVAVGQAWWSKTLHIQTNIFALLPSQQQDPVLDRARAHVNQALNQKVFVVLDAKDPEKLQQATALLRQRMQQHQELWHPLKPQADLNQLGKVYFEHRAGLINAEDIASIQQQDIDALIERSLLQVLSPGMPITGQLLQQDPLLLFPRYMMGLQQQHAAQAIDMQDGFATLEDQQGLSRLLILDLAQSPYNVRYQGQSSAWIAETRQQLQQLGVNSAWTGTLIFSTAGTNSAKDEISTIGLGSSLGVLLLVWFGFRSIRPMLTEFIAVSTGSLLAFAVTHYIFGEIHIMTLVFGASLIGVCVDFSFYFMALQSQQPKRTGFAVLKPILPSLFIGLMTTLVAYVFLSFTPFPGFKQIAVFSMMGLAAAWVSSILLLPRLPALNAAPAIRRLAWIGQARLWMQRQHTVRYGMIVVILITTASSLWWLKSNDDVHNLQTMDPTLQQQDQYIRQRFAQQQGQEYLLLRADSAEQLQQLEQTLLQKLQQLQQDGALQSFQAIAQVIPSVAQQQANIKALQALPDATLMTYADALQLDVATLRQWQQQLSQQRPLSLADFSQHPLAFLQVSPTERLILLQGIHLLPALEQLQSEQVSLIRPVAELSELFYEHRIQAQYLLGYALLALGLALSLIYGIRAIVSLMLPVCMALLSTFAIQAWMGVEINLFSIMAAFLIMGLGVDYAIFYRHGHDHPQVVGMALFLCMMSTLFGFGLLSLSHTYAIHCFGLTVLLGVIFSFVYATLLTKADPRYTALTADSNQINPDE